MLKYVYMKKYNKFFGSTINTVLLLILIALMITAILYMKQNPDIYFPNK